MEHFLTFEKDMTLVHPDDRARVEDEYAVVDDKDDLREIIDIDFRAIHRDGSVRYLQSFPI